MTDPYREACRCVMAGGLVAFPTETVWGLGADARSESAVAALQRFKGRGADAPVAILVDDAASLDPLGFLVPDVARELAVRFWPGPLTLVLPCRVHFAAGVARSDGAVGVRCSSHPVASALAKRLAADGAGPVTATSFNRSGEPAARSRDEAEALAAAASVPRPWLLPEGEAGGAPASTVVDVCGPEARVLRWGALRAEDLEPVLQESGPA